MMKKAILTALAGLIFLACGTKRDNVVSNTNNGTDTNTVEVLYFHGKQRCVTCRTIEQLAREVVEQKYSEKDVVFRVVDISQKENAPMAEQYEVTWSSLIVAKGDKSANLTDMAFANARSNPDRFRSELRNCINNYL